MRSNVGGSEKLTPDGSPQWCVRYSPRKPGSFGVSFVITNSSGTFTLKTDSFEASEVRQVWKYRNALALLETIGGSGRIH